MSLPVFQATIVNDSGDIIPSAVITVLDEITGLGLTVYSNRAGTVPLGTNGVFTAGTDGFAQFFAPAGNYRVKAEQAASGFEKTWDFVPLVGGSAFDVDSYTEFGLGGNAIIQNDANLSSDRNETIVNSALAGANYPDNGIFTIQTLKTNLSNIAGQIALRNLSASGTTAEVGLSIRNTTSGGAWQAWQPVYTGANLNPNVFEANASFDLMSKGYAISATLVSLPLYTTSQGFPASITVVGAFSLYDSTTNTALVTGITPTLNAGSSSKIARLGISGLSGLTAGRTYTLLADSASSKITVNF